MRLLTLGFLAASLAGAAARRAPRFRPPARPFAAPASQPLRSGTPTSANCTELWFNQSVDHFSWEVPPAGNLNYTQRYFVCLQDEWAAQNAKTGVTGPIFFYTGNEADVTLYVNNTGLMWENAAKFGAVLVFAEHRYFGASLPFGAATQQNLQYLSTQQALADYATLVSALKAQWNAEDAPVIGFGGSYGGMLASWWRLKYPHIVDGVVAGSAPIWAFFGETPAIDLEYYNRVMSQDAMIQGGLPTNNCATNIRASWSYLFALGATASGRAQIASAMRLCSVPQNSDDVLAVAEWASNAFSFLAMGSYPYPSPYLLNGDGVLPAYPMRVACGFVNATVMTPSLALLSGLASAAGVFYNYSGMNLPCFDYNAAPNNATAYDGDMWDYIACNDIVMPQSQDGVNDFLWPAPFDLGAYTTGCQQQFGVTPRPLAAQIAFGGKDIEASSNIFFSNGQLDPWRDGGVTQNLTDSIVAYIVADAGHHMDLMFSNPLDNDSVRFVRQMELQHIQQWIDQARTRTAARRARQQARDL